MRKITDGYARQVLKLDGINIPQELIEVKKAHLHLHRAIRFKGKPEEKNVFLEASQYFDNHKKRI